MNRIFIPLICALLLAACAGSNRGQADIAYYDLGPEPTEATAAAVVTLAVVFPAWLDGPSMRYRLDYADPRRLHAYAGARWVASPMQLVDQRLRRHLGLTAAPGPCTLRLEVDEFEQSFVSPELSRAVVRGRARLLGRRLATPAPFVSFDIDVPAPSADAAGGASALAESVGRLSEKLGPWLRGMDLRSCTGTAKS